MPLDLNKTIRREREKGREGLVEDAERMTRDEGTLAPLSYKAVHQNGGRAKWARSRSLCDGCLARNSTAEKLLIEACFRSPFSLSLFLSLSTRIQSRRKVC